MSSTIEQALQEALKFHKDGKLQDAEACYRAILQIQPKHPDANHNLGLIADSFNKPEAALSLFKTALEAALFCINRSLLWRVQTFFVQNKIRPC